MKKIEPEQEEPDFDGLTEEEEAEKVELLSKGFITWSKRDYSAFLRASHDFGRHQLRDIAAAIPTKTYEETVKYADYFWKHNKLIPDWEKQISNIEKGERKIKATENYKIILEALIETTPNPWHQLIVKSPANKSGTIQQYFTVEEDRLILCLTYKFGYGNWDQIKSEISKCWAYKFDWFLQSRNSSEINRRCDALLRQVEKEFVKKEFDYKEHAKNRQKPPQMRPLVKRVFIKISDESEEKKDEMKTKDESVEEQPKGNLENGGKPEKEDSGQSEKKDKVQPEKKEESEKKSENEEKSEKKDKVQP